MKIWHQGLKHLPVWAALAALFLAAPAGAQEQV